MSISKKLHNLRQQRGDGGQVQSSVTCDPTPTDPNTLIGPAHPMQQPVESWKVMKSWSLES